MFDLKVECWQLRMVSMYWMSFWCSSLMYRRGSRFIAQWWNWERISRQWKQYACIYCLFLFVFTSTVFNLNLHYGFYIYIDACMISYKYQNLSHLPLYILVCITNKSFLKNWSQPGFPWENVFRFRSAEKRPFRRFVRSKLVENQVPTRQLLVGHEWQVTTCSGETNCGGMLWTRCKISNGWIRKNLKKKCQGSQRLILFQYISTFS